jgi:hypothetical protein
MSLHVAEPGYKGPVFRCGDLLHPAPISHNLLDQVTTFQFLSAEEKHRHFMGFYGCDFGWFPTNLLVPRYEHELILAHEREPL